MKGSVVSGHDALYILAPVFTVATTLEMVLLSGLTGVLVGGVAGLSLPALLTVSGLAVLILFPFCLWLDRHFLKVVLAGSLVAFGAAGVLLLVVGLG